MKKEDLIVTMCISDLKQLIKGTFEESISQLVNQTKTSQQKTELISRLKVAQLFGVTKTTLDKWRRYGILPPEIKIGSRVYFNSDQIETLIVKRQKNNLSYE
jgi:predicted DNA-binding transcriptional regulator AlpA